MNKIITVVLLSFVSYTTSVDQNQNNVDSLQIYKEQSLQRIDSIQQADANDVLTFVLDSLNMEISNVLFLSLGYNSRSLKSQHFHLSDYKYKK